MPLKFLIRHMQKKLRLQLFRVIAAFLLFTSCKDNKQDFITHIKEVTSAVNDDRLINADKTAGDWLSYGKNYGEDRYSTLEQINKANIKDLGLAWSLVLGTDRGIETTPIVVDGIMYITGPWSKVFCVNAVTGQLIWTYDPHVPGRYGQKACCDVVNRGAALYEGKIFVGTIDGRLVALNAADGKEVWSVLTVDSRKPYSITGAPHVINGKVIIGNSGAEFGVRGYVSAYDATTGKMLWRFYTVPGDPSKPFESEAMQMAAKTWTGDWYKYGGGGTVWDAMAYDPGLKLLYIGTGNGSPWNRQYRSPGGGDNLFLSSILALNPDNGKLVWYYQTTPGDSWDFTATQHMVLADLKIKGRLRKVIMQAPKNGIFYVLDRTNGKLISAKPYTFINWATGVDSITGRPIETEFARYVNENSEIFPGSIGAHNWQPMAFNKKTQLMYFPVRNVSLTYRNNITWKYNQPFSGYGAGLGWNIAIGGGNNSKPQRKETNAPPVGEKLIAWDPVRQREIWSVPHKELWNGGMLTTSAELVFEGNSVGKFIAFDARNGNVLWEKDLGTGIVASPVTYQVNGTQYVTIAVGWGGAIGKGVKYTKQNNPGTIYTFALNKNATMPVFPEQILPKLIEMPFTSTPKEVEKGSSLFIRYCIPCHESVGNGGSSIPDLGYSSEATHKIFKDIVLKGALQPKGMPNFSGKLTKADVENIQKYILITAKEIKMKSINQKK